MARVPSIQTLRAFESAVRHRSYSRAAEELGLTHGAISHRVRELEARLGVRLFDRRGNAMVPTMESNRLVGQVRQALGILDTAFALRDGIPRKSRLTVSVLPSFAARWLVPRLAGFRAAYPHVDIEIDARLELAELGRGGVDAAIRFGGGQWSGLRSVRLAGDCLFPVCSPAMLDTLKLFEPNDLRRAVLLRDSWQPWEPWMRAAGVDLAEPSTGPVYADAGLLLEAAIAGEGVALGRGLLVADDLSAGRLVRPFDTEIVHSNAYYLVWDPNRADHPARIDLEQWLSVTLGSVAATSSEI